MNSTYSFGKLEKREYFLTGFVRISLPDHYHYQMKILQEKKNTNECLS